MGKPGVMGLVTYELLVDCPHCEQAIDLAEPPYSSQYENDPDPLGAAVFGFVDKPAKWDGLNLEYTCAACKGAFVLTSIGY